MAFRSPPVRWTDEACYGTSSTALQAPRSASLPIHASLWSRCANCASPLLVRLSPGGASLVSTYGMPIKATCYGATHFTTAQFPHRIPSTWCCTEEQMANAWYAWHCHIYRRMYARHAHGVCAPLTL